MHEDPEISEEMLMAYVDGELHGGDRDRVRDYLARYPEARARLIPFQGTQDLASIVNEALVGPAPDRLLKTIMDGAETTTGTSGRSGSPRHRRSLWTGLVESAGRWFSRVPMGLPVTALAVGALAGVLIGRDMTASPPSGGGTPTALVVIPKGTLAAAGPLAAALETSLGDKPATLDLASGRATWKPVLTFEAKDGRYCRHFTIASEAGPRSAALACRSATGQWDVEAAEALGSALGSSDVRPVAAGELQDKVEDLIKGEPIAGLPERDLISRHWVK